jgi:demethylmenaquinone methyltransferase/2-methoxy-6-polyprenyl-1,4-benzoquinol methylase
VSGREPGRLEPGEVRAMFDRISPVYDGMNRVMTLGLDRRWRRLAAEAVVTEGDRVVDTCCGTGDLAIACEEAGGVVTGLDFSERMLERARKKSSTIDWQQGDALSLPFADGSFDAASIGFGVRNLDDLQDGLRELRRVLRPGGRLACLEITRPSGILRPFFRLWFDGVVPIVGKVVPGGQAYTYLPASVRRFPGPGELAALLEEAGFVEVGWKLLGGGIVALHTASSPESEHSP